MNKSKILVVDDAKAILLMLKEYLEAAGYCVSLSSSAQEALRIGLINATFPGDKLEEAVMTMARRIAAQSPLAVKWAKRSINVGQEASLNVGLGYEALAECLLFSGKDREEGIKAFFEKRKPQFKGE